MYANGNNRTTLTKTCETCPAQTCPAKCPAKTLGLIGRSPKPEQRDRLNLNRYDALDFVELETQMKADGLWLL